MAVTPTLRAARRAARPVQHRLSRTLTRQARRQGVRLTRAYLGTVDRRGWMSTPELLGVRAAADRMIIAGYPAAPDIRLTPVTADTPHGQVRGEWVEVEGTAPTRDRAVLLYVHGGGFVFGSPATHRRLTGELARRNGRSVFSLDYRLAPRHRFPAAADDVLRAHRWLLDRGVPADGLVVAGDSAGGHLALGLPPRAVRAGLPVPAGVVGFSPAVDPAFTAAIAAGRPDPLVPIGAAVAMLRAYSTEHANPEVGLGTDDLSVMPPVLVQAAEREFCTPDAAAYVEALRTAGVDVDYRTWPRTFHVFQLAHGRMRAADEALDDVAAFVDRVAPADPTDPAGAAG